MDFDDVLNLEEQFYKEGFQEGQDVSAKQSYIEGKEYGLQVGFQKYVIIGVVHSIVQLVKDGSFGEGLSPQITTQLQQLEELVNGIKIDNEYGNVIETEKALVKIRNKLRVFTNMLSTKKSLNLKEIDEISRIVGGLEEEKKSQPSIGNLNDDGMW